MWTASRRLRHRSLPELETLNPAPLTPRAASSITRYPKNRPSAHHSTAIGRDLEYVQVSPLRAPNQPPQHQKKPAPTPTPTPDLMTSKRWAAYKFITFLSMELFIPYEAYKGI
jgi:hypothetical protein